MIKKLLVLALLVTLAVPVLAYAKMKAPGIMDDEDIMTSESLAKYKVVGVKVFSTDNISYDNVDDEEMRKMPRFLEDLQRTLARTLVRDLENDGLKAFVIEEGEGNGDAEMIVEGRFTQVNLGSAVGRFMFWGAGQAGIKAEGKLKDAGTGDVLAAFEHENSSGLDQGEKWNMVEHEAEDLGDKIADFIKELSR